MIFLSILKVHLFVFRETLSYHSLICDLLNYQKCYFETHVNQQNTKFIESGNKEYSEILSNTVGTAKEIATLIKYSQSVKTYLGGKI